MTSYQINLVGAVDPARRVASWRLVDPVVWIYLASWLALVGYCWLIAA